MVSLIYTNGCVPACIFDNSFLGGRFGLTGLDGFFAGLNDGIVLICPRISKAKFLPALDLGLAMGDGFDIADVGA
jgi:hypothetical protein